MFETIQNTVEDAVVQVFAQIVTVNWLEPYTLREQYEQRGTGFCIDQDGYIITGAHVVDGAQTVWIQISSFGHQSFFVDIMGFCPEHDVAMLKLRDEDIELVRNKLGALPALPLGDSNAIRRADPVLIVGYPLGQTRIKSSTGVISGWESEFGSSLIQTTAPINPGSSGGPLVDRCGQAIGIAVLVAYNAQNVGYAIPINDVKLILENLRKPGLIRTPNLGIVLTYGSTALAKVLGNPLPSGIYIKAVMKGSIADKAGVQSGDMLYAINGNSVDPYGDLSIPPAHETAPLVDFIARLSIGDTVKLMIYRQGARHELSSTFVQGEPPAIRTLYPNYEPVDYEVIGGLVIMPLVDSHLELLAEQNPYLIMFEQAEYRVDPVLIISHILPGSPAHLARNIAPGMLIKAVNGVPVNTVEGLREAIRKSLTSGFLTVETRDKTMVAFDFPRLIANELRLAQYFHYKPAAICSDPSLANKS